MPSVVTSKVVSRRVNLTGGAEICDEFKFAQMAFSRASLAVAPWPNALSFATASHQAQFHSILSPKTSLYVVIAFANSCIPFYYSQDGDCPSKGSLQVQLELLCIPMNILVEFTSTRPVIGHLVFQPI